MLRQAFKMDNREEEITEAMNYIEERTMRRKARWSLECLLTVSIIISIWVAFI